jgi:hypothetical protein
MLAEVNVLVPAPVKGGRHTVADVRPRAGRCRAGTAERGNP